MSHYHKFKDSSSISHCDYDPVEKILKIKFHSSDKEHEFLNCPQNIYEGLKQAESAGKYFHANIRNKFTNR
jgi:hypothetical protein